MGAVTTMQASASIAAAAAARMASASAAAAQRVTAAATPSANASAQRRRRKHSRCRTCVVAGHNSRTCTAVGLGAAAGVGSRQQPSSSSSSRTAAARALPQYWQAAPARPTPLNTRVVANGANVAGYILVDIKVTDGSREQGLIIHIAAEAVGVRLLHDARSSTDKRYSSYVSREGRSIRYSQHAREHKITDATLDALKPRGQAVVMKEFVGWLEARCAELVAASQQAGAFVVLVAHNGFSCGFKYLIHTLARHGLAMPASLSVCLDTAIVARGARNDRRFDTSHWPSSNKLADLFKHFTNRDLPNDVAEATTALLALLGQLEMRAEHLKYCQSWALVVKDERVRQDMKQRAAAAQAAAQADGDRCSDAAMESEGLTESEGDSDTDDTATMDWRRTADRVGSTKSNLFTGRRRVKVRGGLHTPEAAFNRLWARVELHLVKHTNLYAKQLRAAELVKDFLTWCCTARHRGYDIVAPFTPNRVPWAPVTVKEMRLLMLSVVHNDLVASTDARVTSWSDNPLHTSKPFTKAVTHSRCKQIMRYLHMSDALERCRAQTWDPLYKVRRLLGMAKATWRSAYECGGEVAVLESVIETRRGDAAEAAQSSKRRRNGFGLKTFVLVEVGTLYCPGFRIKVGDWSPADGTRYEGTHQAMALLEEAGLLDAHRTVYTEEYYTSTELLVALQARQTYLVGRVMKTRTPAVAKLQAADGKSEGAHVNTWSPKFGGVLLVGWRSRGKKYFLTNACDSGCDADAASTSTGAGAGTSGGCRSGSGRGRSKVPQPNVVTLYDHGMDPVEEDVDQQFSIARRQWSESTSHKSDRSDKWPLRVLWHILDLTLDNALVLLNASLSEGQHDGGDEATHHFSRREFREELLASALRSLDPRETEVDDARHVMQTLATHTLSKNEFANEKRRVRKRTVCPVCTEEGKSQGACKTTTSCTTCNTGLCLQHHIEYHTSPAWRKHREASHVAPTHRYKFRPSKKMKK